MTLFEKLTEDMKTAMKGKDVRTLEVVRMLISNVKNKAMELNREMEDADVIAVVKSDAKKVRDAMEEFARSAREDLVAKSKEEIAILERYLPPQMSHEDLVAKVKEKAAELGVAAKAQAGKIIGVLNKELGGQASGDSIKKAVDDVFTE